MKLPGQVVVNDVDADLLGALLGVLEFVRTEVVYQESDVVPDPLVIGPELFCVEILEGTPKVCVLQERLEHFLLQVVHVVVV